MCAIVWFGSVETGTSSCIAAGEEAQGRRCAHSKSNAPRITSPRVSLSWSQPLPMLTVDELEGAINALQDELNVLRADVHGEC